MVCLLTCHTKLDGVFLGHQLPKQDLGQPIITYHTLYIFLFIDVFFLNMDEVAKARCVVFLSMLKKLLKFVLFMIT